MEPYDQWPAHALSPERPGTKNEDVAALLAATASDLCDLTQTSFCAISRVHEDDAVVVACQGRRSRNAPAPGSRWRVGDAPPARQAMATGEPVGVVTRDDPRLTQGQRLSLTGDPELTSLAFFPLVSDQQTVGVIVLADTRPRDLAAAAPRLAAVARLTALALAQDERLTRLTRAADDLALVLDADIEAQSRTTGPEQVLRVIARRFAELCHVPMVDISSLQGDGLRVLVSWQNGAFVAGYEGTVEALSDWPLTRAAALSGHLEVVTDLDDPRLTPAAIAQLARWDIVSNLIVPLKSHGRVIGVVEVLDTAPRDYAEVLRPARALADIAAHILDKALLLEAAERHNQAMREIVALGTHVNQTGDPVEMSRYVAERVLEITGCCCCEVYRVDNDTLRCLMSVDTRPGYEDPRSGLPVDLRRFPSLMGAIAERDVLAFGSIDDPRLTEEERRIYREWKFGSELSIPLLVGDRLVGLIDVFDDRPRDFNEHLDFARSTAQIVAGAFDNLLLLERLEKGNQELRLLAESSLEFGASLDLDHVLRSVAARMCLAAGAACCNLYALEGTTLRGLVSSDGGEIDAEFPGSTLDLSATTLARRAVDRGQPVASGDLENVGDLSDKERDLPGTRGFRALLELPLLDHGQVVGLASICDRRPREWGPDDLLRGLGQIAAQAMGNAKVHRRLDAQAERLMLVSDAGLELASTLDLAHVLDATAKRLCAIAAVDSCEIYSLRGDELRCEASILNGEASPEWLQKTYFLPEWRSSRLAVDSRSIVNVVTTDDARLSELERDDMVGAGQKSALLVPLVVENRVIGLAELRDSSRERAFGDEEIGTVEAVCRVAALAIANAGLYRDVQLRSREAELLNQIAVRVGSSLETSTIAAATVEELSKLVPFTDACLVMGAPGQPRRVIYASSADIEAYAESIKDAAPTGLERRLQRERVAILDLDDLQADADLPPEVARMRSVLAIGIWIDEQPAGVLALLSPEPDAFADADHHLLARLGTQLALSFKNAGLYETIKTMHVSNLKALISALNARDYYAVGHAARVAAYMLLLGRELDWPDERMQQLTEASFLHDVGRIGVADDVLFKPGRLSDEETIELRRHPITSAEIVAPLFSEDLVAAIRHHHERWDGTGYPDGLTGDEIPEVARALCIVDSYDAMSFQRPHHAALSYAECLGELENCRGQQFDPIMVTAFMRVLDRLDERRSVAREAAERAAARIDGTALTALSTLGDEEKPEYAQMAATLREVRDTSPPVRFLTTMTRDHNGWKIICDPEEDPELRSHLGDLADGTFGRSIAEGDLTDRNVLHLDDYGLWVCGEADVTNARGEVVGIVNADLAPADDWPDELGANVSGRDQAFATIVESATARLGRARVDAVTDGLTGLYNQRYFKQRLKEEVARATELDRPLSLLFCDLDHFKRYNDTFGHTAGDRALHAAGSVLLRSIRQVDLAARYGGEEFAVILIDSTAEYALEVAERVRAGVAGLDLGGPERKLTVSIGVAGFPTDATMTEELVDKADWAMYLAKRQGRDRVAPFRPESRDDEKAASRPR